MVDSLATQRVPHEFQSGQSDFVAIEAADQQEVSADVAFTVSGPVTDKS